MYVNIIPLFLVAIFHVMQNVAESENVKKLRSLIVVAHFKIVYRFNKLFSVAIC